MRCPEEQAIDAVPVSSAKLECLRKRLTPAVVADQDRRGQRPAPLLGQQLGAVRVGRRSCASGSRCRDTWDADEFELISDFIDVGDRVAVRFIWPGAGHGPESNVEVTGVYTVRKGKLFNIDFFWAHVEALEAVGLSEQDAPAQGS